MIYATVAGDVGREPRMMIRHAKVPVLLLLSVLSACGGSPTDALTSSEKAVASVKIVSPFAAVASLAQGTVARLNVDLRDKRGSLLTPIPMRWKSSDSTIVSVSADGDVRGIRRSGTALITATAGSASDTITISTYWGYVSSITPKNQVKVIPLTIPDDARSRSIRIIVRVPVDAPGPVPVIFSVFGLLNTEEVEPDYGNVLASAGYVVVHTGTAPYVQKQLCAEFGVTDCNEMIWPTRIATARDVKVLLDNLTSIGTRAGVTLDAARIGVSGTSSGGAIVMYLAGATTDLSPTVKAVSLAESRIIAFLGNSAPATRTDNGSFSGFSDSSWARITRPTMQQALAGDVDAAGRRLIFDVMPRGDKYLAFFNTQAIVSYNPLQQEPFGGLIMSNALAFFDTYLRGSAEAKKWLTTNELAHGSIGLAQMSTK